MIYSDGVHVVSDVSLEDLARRSVKAKVLGAIPAIHPKCGYRIEA